MRTTVLLDAALVETAKEYTGLHKTSQVINYVLEDYIKRMSQQRLALLKGSYSESELSAPIRRRLN